MYRSWSLDSVLLRSLEEGNFPGNEEEIVLLSMKFSPIAVKVDSFLKCRVCNFFKKVVVKCISIITPHVNVTMTLRFGSYRSNENVVHCAREGHENLMAGKSIVLHTEFLSSTSIAVLLLWRFNRGRKLWDIYSSLRRRVPECQLTLREQMDLPMMFSLLCETTYTPSSDIIHVEKSILS